MSGMKHSKAWIKVNGAILETMAGAKLNLGGNKRDAVVGATKVLGYSETLEPARIECEISLGQGISLSSIKDITAATVTYEADTGQTYVVRNAFVSETLEVTAGDGGKVRVVLVGDPAEEMQ